MKRRVIMPSWCWTICKTIILKESQLGLDRIAADLSYKIPSVFKIRIGCYGKCIKIYASTVVLGLVLHNKIPSHLYHVVLCFSPWLVSRLLLSCPTEDKTVISPRLSWRRAGLPPEQKSPWHPSQWQWVPGAFEEFEPTPSAILLLGCNTSSKLSSDLVQASTLYCQGDKTSPRNVCSSWWGSKAAGFGQPTSQTRYCYSAPFPIFVLEGGSSCDDGWKRVRTEECVPRLHFICRMGLLLQLG